jgi:hypothetical protein
VSRTTSNLRELFIQKSVTYDALAGFLKVIALQDADRSQLCGSNDTAGRSFTLPLYSRIIFGRLVCPSESGASRPQRDWGMIFEVRHGENVYLYAGKTVL